MAAGRTSHNRKRRYEACMSMATEDNLEDEEVENKDQENGTIAFTLPDGTTYNKPLLPRKYRRLETFMKRVEDEYKRIQSNDSLQHYLDIRKYYDEEIGKYNRKELPMDSTSTEIFLPQSLIKIQDLMNEAAKAYNQTRNDAHKDKYVEWRKHFLKELGTFLKSQQKGNGGASWLPRSVYKLRCKMDCAFEYFKMTQNLQDYIKYDRLMDVYVPIHSVLKRQQTSLNESPICTTSQRSQEQQLSQGAIPEFNPRIPPPGYGLNQQPGRGAIPIFNPRVPPPVYGRPQ